MPRSRNRRPRTDPRRCLLRVRREAVKSIPRVDRLAGENDLMRSWTWLAFRPLTAAFGLHFHQKRGLLSPRPPPLDPRPRHDLNIPGCPRPDAYLRARRGFQACRWVISATDLP